MSDLIHSDELTGDFGNKPAILIGDHGLSCLLAEKLSLRDLRLWQQYRHKADIRLTPANVRYRVRADIVGCKVRAGSVADRANEAIVDPASP